ncbi:MAG: hypothetical protein J6A28_03325 [Clostridia bacterium]|nr:hypothetical protein [Clostridia bacterium]
MKKSIKGLAIGLAVIPCALAMTACGGDDRLVNTSGRYATESSYEEVATYLEDKELSTELASFQIRMKADFSINTEAYKFSMLTTGDMYMKVSGEGETATIDMYSKATMSINQNGEKEELSEIAYINDNIEYTKVQDSWEQLPIDPADYISQYSLDFETLFASLGTEDLDSIEVKVDKYENSGTFKVKMTMDASLLGDLTNFIAGEAAGYDMSWDDLILYYIFENNQFVGAAIEIGAGITEGANSISLKATMELAPYAGEIEFPEEIA